MALNWTYITLAPQVVTIRGDGAADLVALERKLRKAANLRQRPQCHNAAVPQCRIGQCRITAMRQCHIAKMRQYQHATQCEIRMIKNH